MSKVFMSFQELQLVGKIFLFWFCIGSGELFCEKYLIWFVVGSEEMTGYMGIAILWIVNTSIHIKIEVAGISQ